MHKKEHAGESCKTRKKREEVGVQFEVDIIQLSFLYKK